MSTLTITAKGQVTLKKELLEHMGVRPGDQIEVRKKPDGGLSVTPRRRTGKLSDAFGMLKRPGQRALTIEEINEAIAEAGAEAGMRGLEDNA